MSNGASDFIGERKKMGVKINHGLKFGIHEIKPRKKDPAILNQASMKPTTIERAPY